MEKDPFAKTESFVNESLNNKIIDLSTRIKLLEERYSNFRREEQLAEQNLIALERRVSKEFKDLDERLLDIKRAINNLKDDLAMMSSEIKRAVRHHEFKALEKYIMFWAPVDFLTRDEARKMLDEKKTL